MLTPVPKHPGIFEKDNRYQVRYRHYGTQRAKSFRTLTEAVRFKAKVDSGDTQPSSRVSFKVYAARWLDSYTGRTAKGLSDSTRASYRDAIERLAVPYFKTTPLERIDPPTLRKFIAHLAGKGLAPASVRRAYAPLRALLATAYEDGLIRSNPAHGVRVVVKDKRTAHPKWLTSEQTKALLTAMDPHHADLVYFLATTGCRISEALHAVWADMQTDDDGRPVLVITHAKTEAGLRTIPLSPETMRRLTRRRAETRHGAPADPIFPSRDGTPMDARNWRRRAFKPAAEKAGAPWATPHMLRHGLASLMARQGYSASQIAAHLGHADGGVLALRTYVHSDRLADIEFADKALT